MISTHDHQLAGDNLAERQARLDRGSRKERAKNREAMIPDMEPGPHQPAEWFAELGWHHILSLIGQNDPVDDWSEDGGTQEHHDLWLKARAADAKRVRDWMLAQEIGPIAHSDGVRIGHFFARWPDRIPGLKTWSGNQSLPKIMRKYQSALAALGDVDLMACTAPIGGASGMDRGTAVTALDLGFSAYATGMDVETRIGMEMLAVVGLEIAPITVFPDSSFVYGAGGKMWRFRREERNHYYGRWAMAEEFAPLPFGVGGGGL